jgi:hypothetical protein
MEQEKEKEKLSSFRKWKNSSDDLVLWMMNDN